MTSNIGSHIIQQNLEKASKETEAKQFDKTFEEILKLLKSTIRPEFLNRIDEIIMFKPLNKDEIKRIVKIQLKIIQDKLSKTNISIHASEEAIDYISNLGYDPQYGARPIKRVIQKNILNELSKYILKGDINKDSTINISLNNNTLTFNNI